MLMRATQSWVHDHRRQLAFGLLSGALWGFLTAGGATPRAWLVYDTGQQVIRLFRPELAEPITISSDIFFETYTSNLIQVTLTFLLLCIIAGWVAWQLSRIRPRGQQQLPLRTGWDVFIIAFLLGGLVLVVLFQELNLGEWFKGRQPTSAVLVTALLGIILPLFDGIGGFLIWFLRLNSIRAPDWETHYPPPRDWIRPLLQRLVRMIRPEGKGGKKIERDTSH
jgi:hypothetical protein